MVAYLATSNAIKGYSTGHFLPFYHKEFRNLRILGDLKIHLTILEKAILFTWWFLMMHQNSALKPVLEMHSSLPRIQPSMKLIQRGRYPDLLTPKWKVKSRIPTRSGSRLGMTICTESNTYFAGFTIKEVGKKLYLCQNRRGLLLSGEKKRRHNAWALLQCRRI
jgi:hypothetical protein